jgi:hypothetical protein
LGDFCLHEYLFSIGLRIRQMSIKSFLSMNCRRCSLFFLCVNTEDPPNSDEIYLLEDFCNRIEQFNDMPIVCGGDWNLIMENIDKLEAPRSLYSSIILYLKNY